MRFAHFSDLHLLSLTGARFLDFANKRWIGGANLLASRGRHYHAEVFEALVADLADRDLDHVICTGDITNLALEQEFVFAREHFDRIALGPTHVTVIPGNHDAYVRKGTDFFAGYFADYHEADDDWAWGSGEPWPMVRVRGDLAIVGLSTSRTTPWFTAYGRVGAEQLERLAAILGDPRLATKFRVLALHHPPAGKGARSRIRGLRDHQALAAVLAEAGAELVLHGHEHQDLGTWLPIPGGEVTVRGIQAGSYEAGKPPLRARYRIYELSVRQWAGSRRREERQRVGEGSRPILGSEEMRVWDPESRVFVADPANSP